MTSAPARTEVAVVGGGIVGLAVAHALAQRGRQVTVLEGARVGERAAAHVAAGMLAPSSEVDLSDPRLTDLALAAHAMYGAWTDALTRETGIETGYDATGTLLVALHADHLAILQHLYEFQVERGLPAERLSAQAARDAEPYLAPGIAGALRMPDAQVDPRRLLRALPVALERLGVALVEGTRVTAIGPSDDGYAIETECEGVPATLHATQVVATAGAWTRQIASPIEGMPVVPVPMRPVKGQILRLRGERLIRHVVRTPDVYIVPRADGELVIGASMEDVGFDARVRAGAVHDLLREARRAVPGITELDLAECNVGFRPALRDHLPAIGSVDGAGLFVATGHFRNGVELAPITARLLADLICDGRLDALLEPFSPQRFASPARAEASR
ncbi:MAG: glycine oxidase ThiO [Dehalococcoidia bacterium]